MFASLVSLGKGWSKKIWYISMYLWISTPPLLYGVGQISSENVAGPPITVHGPSLPCGSFSSGPQAVLYYNTLSETHTHTLWGRHHGSITPQPAKLAQTRNDETPFQQWHSLPGENTSGTALLTDGWSGEVVSEDAVRHRRKTVSTQQGGRK